VAIQLLPAFSVANEGPRHVHYHVALTQTLKCRYVTAAARVAYLTLGVGQCRVLWSVKAGHDTPSFDAKRSPQLTEKCKLCFQQLPEGRNDCEVRGYRKSSNVS
jgi:hypothetical protein